MVSTRTQDGTITAKSYSPVASHFGAVPVTPPPIQKGKRAARPGRIPKSPTRVKKPMTPGKVRKEVLLLSPASPTFKKTTSKKRAAADSPDSPPSKRPASRRKTTAVESEAGPSGTWIPPVPQHIKERKLCRKKAEEGPTESVRADKGKGKGKGKLPSRATTKKGIDYTGGRNFFPSVIIGAEETEGLSKVGRADKEVQEWEEILQQHEEFGPDLVPIVQAKLDKAIKDRAALDDTLEENNIVGDANPAATAIEERLSSLRWGLETSQFPPEADNIRCAIKGYRDGSIPYSEHFTIIYAGKIVDTAPDYNSFVKDRTARLDRYFRTYGEGWIWYESPLNIPPDSHKHLLPCATLPRKVCDFNMGTYYITQGYWKRSGFVMRMSPPAAFLPAAQEPLLRVMPDGSVDCQQNGAKMSFRTLLDSGASFPSLHTEDLIRLSINPIFYGAQSIARLLTAGGNVDTRMYELFVTVLSDDGKQLVDPQDPCWTGAPGYLGGLCPVSQSKIPLLFDENGKEKCVRLSGLLPFLCSYVSATPARAMMHFGEDRNDVIGAHKMPGQKRWDLSTTNEVPPVQFNKYGDPRIVFGHRNGLILDEDAENATHTSRVTIKKPESGENLVVAYRNPGNKSVRRWVVTNEAYEAYTGPGVPPGRVFTL